MKLFINIGFDESDNAETAAVSITVDGVVHHLNSENGAIVVDCPAPDIEIVAAH